MKRPLTLAAMVMTLASASLTSAQATRPGVTPAVPAPVKSPAFDSQVRAEISAALDAFQTSGESAEAKARLHILFDQVLSRAGEKQLDLLRDSAFALGLVDHLEALSPKLRRELLPYLRAHDTLARALVFTLGEKDDLPAAYALFDRLRTSRPTQVDPFANLVAALCAVHDKPLIRQINEETVKAPDPLALFDFFVANENSMAFGIRNVPPELLIYVVDVTTPVDDLFWANKRYARDANIGRHFFDVPYDYASYREGAKKKILSADYTLGNILTIGGVCADQAYFTVSSAKGIGIPSAYTWGASGEVAHAWVGFLQQQNGRGVWNFDSGRYEQYKGVRGNVEDPQTRQRIPDAYVSYTAELIGTKPADRQTAASLTLAARRLLKAEESPEGFSVAELPAALSAAPAIARTPGVDAELRLCRLALQQNPGHADAWLTVAFMARQGKLTLAQKKEWSDLLMTQCGQRYPDFAVAVLVPMIETIDDARQQNSLWNAVFDRFKNRFDLAAYIRMRQAACWEKQNDVPKAGECYLDVINRYANAGPFVLSALVAAENALPVAGKPQRAAALYEIAWAKCEKPSVKTRDFAMQSNWFRVGALLLDRQIAADNGDRAAKVRKELEGYVGASK